jgi:hypothetical protein
VKSRLGFLLAIGLVVSLFTASFSAMAQNDDTDDENDAGNDATTQTHDFEIHGFDFEDPDFSGVWERTDKPVLDGNVERSWLWGPRANTEVFNEPYVEAEGGMREVQYGDKSRMEQPAENSSAAADEEDSPWVITQGLLAVELMTGNLQVGDDTFLPFPPAEIPVAGDWEDNPGPTYADMGTYMEWDARTTGNTITQYLDEDGNVSDDERFAEYGVFDRYYIQETDHNIASVFWDFMQSEGLVYENDELTTGPLFLDEFYAIGFPVTEAYWGEFRLQNEVQDILIQCFERRCLTYAPGNALEWQVESGNVGLHYHEWRYNIIGDPIADLTIGLDPVDAINPVGTEYTLTATLLEDGEPVAVDDLENVDVTIDRVSENDDDSADLTDNGNDTNGNDINAAVELENGAVTVSYTGPDTTAVDTITVEITHGEDTVQASTTKSWVLPEPEYAVELAHEHEVNPTDTPHTFTATLTEDEDAFDIASADDVSVSVLRDDATEPINFGTDDLDISVEDNVATITYTGPDAFAVDAIDVSVMVNGEEIVGEPTLTKTWCEAVVENGDSIQAAIDAADEGDTICVMPGTYNESIVIDVDGLTLWAVDGPEETTIQSDNAGTGAVGTPGVVGINADDVVVDGFTIDNEDAADGRTIRVNANVDGVTIQNNILENSVRGVQGDWDGQGGDNITIEDNVFNTDIGVGGTEGMNDVTITGNTFNTTVEGITFGEGIGTFTITSNHFAGEEDHVIDWRAAPDTAALQAIINNNTFENPVEIVGGNAIRDVAP